MSIKRVITTGKSPVKIWTDHINQNAVEQLENMSQLPFIHKHIAAMPDVHLGKGATIGSVIPTKGAIVPAAVGVDLGCGMQAAKLSLTASDLPDNLKQIRSEIEFAVPHGRSNNGKYGDVGGWSKRSRDFPHEDVWNNLKTGYEDIRKKHPKVKAYNTWEHVGTLGGGNHFIELCLDECDSVWVMLHSGSRGIGNKIGSYFIEKAKKEMEKYFIGEYLPDKNLSYLVENTEIFMDYCDAVSWAQNYAKLNRNAMMSVILCTLLDNNSIPEFEVVEEVIDCHHNYIAKENHFNANVWVTRKGAIRAKEGDLGIIPGSMGDKSFIVAGKGNKNSFCSCSHGAGRKLGRKQAIKQYTVDDLVQQTKGIECPKDDKRVDEIPSAYKNIDQVMEDQKDLVSIVHTLKQVLNIKG